eukprot:NODE_6637_length_1653_cov_5.816514.p1 GENE.NODE_6637_length_1653_cov_5.816514~~NODE_6637_length_1653_cov_5.816514.p1  ORF type:complete len:484 (-),score=111.56 NODE_6637_length_1653_cov_5.816514:202-1584(-)
MAAGAENPKLESVVEAPPAQTDYGAVANGASDKFWDTVKWLEAADATDPVRLCTWVCDDFKPRKIKAPLVFGWLVLQGICFVFQALLWMETAGHLSQFEATLAANCGPEHLHQGVCIAPGWRLSLSQELYFSASGEMDTPDFDFIIPSDTNFSFSTDSMPLTALLGVEPQPPMEKASWKVSISEQGNPAHAMGATMPLYGKGARYIVVEDKTGGGHSTWSGSLSLLSKSDEPMVFHVYVIDSAFERFEGMQHAPQCSFEATWVNFSERHSGQHHRVLSAAHSLSAFFLLVSIFTVSTTFYRFYFSVKVGKLMSRIVVLKFLLQDFPLQVIVVAYLYGWYGSNGLRCQMCLFHADHCDDEHPLHWSNLMLCVFTVLSAASCQLLLQTKNMAMNEDDEFFICFSRFSIFSVTVVPFSTGLLFLSGSLLHIRSVWVYISAGIITMFGWSTLVCVPCYYCCDEC